MSIIRNIVVDLVETRERLITEFVLNTVKDRCVKKKVLHTSRGNIFVSLNNYCGWTVKIATLGNTDTVSVYKNNRLIAVTKFKTIFKEFIP